MSWLTRWKIDNMKKWGGWHSLEERENYLLSEVERLENDLNNVKLENKVLNEKLNHVEERAISAVVEYSNKNVIFRHCEDSYYDIAEKTGGKNE